MGKVAGAILAGGKSSRMGEDKARLRLEGRTLLQHMEAVLRRAGLESIYISHPDFIPDETPRCGPLGGVYSILKNVSRRHEHIIFVPIDMPDITPDAIAELISAPDEAPLVHFEGYKMPFRISVGQNKVAEELLKAGGDVSLGNLQDNISGCLRIKTDINQNHFRNINTPEEWRAFSKEELV